MGPITAGIVTLCLQGVPEPPSTPLPGADAAIGAEIAQAVERAGEGQFWGAILVGRKGHQLYAAGYGMADYRRRANAPDTLFELASVSKQVTATAILRLAQDRKLKLDDPITRFFKKVPADKRAITVRQLLHHTSGLDNNGVLGYAARETRDEFAAMLLAKPLMSEPGATFAYNNPGYALLAAIVERASGTTFERYCHKKLFTPAKLEDTGFLNERQLDRTRETTRQTDRPGLGGTACDWHYGWGYRGMGGVVSTAEDVWRWDQALRGDRVLKPEWQDVLHTPALENYACGWRVSTTARGTRKAEHSGSVAGYVHNIARYLEDEVCIVVLSNGKTNVHAIEQAIAAVLLKPPTVSAEIRHRGLTLSPNQAVGMGEGARFDAKRDGAHVVVSLYGSWSKTPVADIRCPADAARALVAGLEAACKGKPAADSEMDAGLFLGGYRLTDAPLVLDGELALVVQPNYRGRGRDGQPFVDERPTLILQDGRTRQWPIMARMSAVDAAALAAKVAALLD